MVSQTERAHFWAGIAVGARQSADSYPLYLSADFLAAGTLRMSAGSGLAVPVLDVVAFSAPRFVVVHFVLIGTCGVPWSSFRHRALLWRDGCHRH
jgi:hypothetical protein